MTDERSHAMPTRRRFLQSGVAVALGAAAGCLESRSPFAPPVVEDRPEAVYIPSHFEGMEPIGATHSGPLSARLTFSYPHRFWLLSGADRSRVRIQPDDSLHLMVQVWEEESGTVISGATPSVSVKRDASVVTERVFWPMLSQQMGFHYGDNLELPEDGTYSISVALPPSTDQLDGRFGTALSGHHRFDFTLDWRSSRLDEIPIQRVSGDRSGTRNALSAMSGGMAPLNHMSETLPGRSLGTAESDEMVVVASVMEGDAEGRELLLTVGTPYNRFAIPMVGPVAAIGETTHRLRSALHPSIGMHYRTTLREATAGEAIEVRFPTPPQVARHEGYETAFMDPTPVRFSI